MVHILKRTCGSSLHLRKERGILITENKCIGEVPKGIPILKLIEDYCKSCVLDKHSPFKRKEPLRMPMAKNPVGKKKTRSNLVTAVEGGKIVRSDAIKLLKSLEDESIDLAIFDPAYESLEKWRKTGTTTRLKQSKGSSNEWFETFPNTNYTALFSELFRVMKKGTFIYMFCDEETRDIVTTGFSPQTPGTHLINEGDSGPNSPLLRAGFKFWKSLVWDKVHKGMGYHYPAQHEFILMAEKVVKKGKHRKLNTNKTGDVISCARLKGKNFYPTEKPLPLMWKLITESSNEGDTVLDFFCGSGVVGAAARLCGREFILGDIKPDEAIRRLSSDEQ